MDFIIILSMSFLFLTIHILLVSPVIFVVIFLVLCVWWLVLCLLLLWKWCVVIWRFSFRFVLYVVSSCACDSNHNLLVANKLLHHWLHESDKGLGFLEDNRRNHLAVFDLEVSIREQALLDGLQRVEINATDVFLAKSHLGKLVVVVEIEVKISRFA